MALSCSRRNPWARPGPFSSPGLDVRSILSMLETVMDEYAVNTNRILVSGLSDGGTFSYALGISCSKLFAGIAPIAGVLPPWLDYKQATALPIFIVHGAKDFIFPVSSARMARDFLEGQDFAHVSYTELPRLGARLYVFHQRNPGPALV